MKISFSIEKWFALSSGLSDPEAWITWSKNKNHDWNLPIAKSAKLSALQARRMSVPSRLAIDVGLHLIKDTNTTVDFAIFVSRHGELERTHKILETLNLNQDISPTDFALSVHNTASGLLTIIANQTIPISSISASEDGFHQGLIEAFTLIKQNYSRILLIDFDGAIPNIYHSQINSTATYATGFILTAGDNCTCESIEKNIAENDIYQPHYPQALAFLHGYLSQQPSFKLSANRHNWLWTVNHK